MPPDDGVPKKVKVKAVKGQPPPAPSKVEISELVTFLMRSELRNQLPTRFDSICKILNMTFKTPLSGICLVCRDTESGRLQVFKIAGIARECEFVEYENSIVESLFLGNMRECSYVEDALQHPVYCTHPYVTGAFKLRFIAGSPLWASDGTYIGAAVVADQKPRTFTQAEAMLMTNLSDVVLRDLEHFYLMTKKEFERSDAETLNLNLDNNLGHGILLVDREWKNVFGNLTWEKISGYSKAETESKGFWDVFEEEEGLTAHDLGFLRHSTPSFQLSGFLRRSNGMRIACTAVFVIIEKDQEEEGRAVIARDGDALKKAFADLEAENKADNETIQSATRNSTWMVTITPMAKASRPHVEVSLDTAGITIGDVTLQRKIGQGGYGIVFAGQWEDRTVAVKFTQRIAEKSQSSAGSGAAKGAEGEGSAAVTGIHGGFKDPFLEALLSVSLIHRNLVRSFKYVLTKDGADIMLAVQGLALGRTVTVQPTEVSRMIASGSTVQPSEVDAALHVSHVWLIQEYCDMGTLDSAALALTFAPAKAGSLAYFLSTVWDIAQGLKHLHGKNLIHGDLTGNNVLLMTTPGGALVNGKPFIAKVADFGLSKIKDRNADQHSAILTNTFGTVTFMPPELVCACILSTSTDAYSFGALMYMMYVGARPFQGLREPQILARFLLSAPGRSMFKLPESMDPDLSALIRDCTRHEHKLRPAASEIADRIEMLWRKTGLEGEFGALVGPEEKC